MHGTSVGSYAQSTPLRAMNRYPKTPCKRRVIYEAKRPKCSTNTPHAALARTPTLVAFEINRNCLGKVVAEISNVLLCKCLASDDYNIVSG